MAADEDMGVCDWAKRERLKQSRAKKIENKIRRVIALQDDYQVFPTDG
jgi:hypothetical protein